MEKCFIDSCLTMRFVSISENVVRYERDGLIHDTRIRYTGNTGLPYIMVKNVVFLLSDFVYAEHS
jgi:hypothetical protein